MNKIFKLIPITILFLLAIYFSTPIDGEWVLVIAWAIVVVFGLVGYLKIINDKGGN